MMSEKYNITWISIIFIKRVNVGCSILTDWQEGYRSEVKGNDWLWLSKWLNMWCFCFDWLIWSLYLIQSLNHSLFIHFSLFSSLQSLTLSKTNISQSFNNFLTRTPSESWAGSTPPSSWPSPHNWGILLLDRLEIRHYSQFLHHLFFLLEDVGVYLLGLEGVSDGQEFLRLLRDKYVVV